MASEVEEAEEVGEGVCEEEALTDCWVWAVLDCEV